MKTAALKAHRGLSNTVKTIIVLTVIIFIARFFGRR